MHLILEGQAGLVENRNRWDTNTLKRKLAVTFVELEATTQRRACADQA